MSVALDSVQWQTVYPMDYYSNDSLGPWTNNNEAHRPVRQRRPRPVIGSKGDKSSPRKDNSIPDKQVSSIDTMHSKTCKENDCDKEKNFTKENSEGLQSETGASEEVQSEKSGGHVKVETETCCRSSLNESCLKPHSSNS